MQRTQGRGSRDTSPSHKHTHAHTRAYTRPKGRSRVPKAHSCILHNGNSYFTDSHTADQYDTAQIKRERKKKKRKKNWEKIQGGIIYFFETSPSTTSDRTVGGRNDGEEILTK